MGGIIISKVLGARMFYWFADTGLSHLYQDNWECWFNISTNGREIEFETIHGFSRVTDFYEYDGVTNDKTERQIALTRLLRSNVLRNLCDWLTSMNLDSCILIELARSTWLESIKIQEGFTHLRHTQISQRAHMSFVYQVLWTSNWTALGLTNQLTKDPYEWKVIGSYLPLGSDLCSTFLFQLVCSDKDN
jgi:hypothetical protein